MRFESPFIFWWLGIVPILALVFYFAFRHYTRISSKFVEQHLFDSIAMNVSLRLRALRYGLLLGVVVMSIVALARPQWGFQVQTIKRQGVDILIAIDVSKSMLTQDVKPSRLERTKFAVKDFIHRLKGDRIGLIAFAGEPFLMCPLTIDYNGFLMTLDDLSPDSIPRGGTDLGKAIEESIKDYGSNKQSYKAVILVTDGEEEQGNALAAAQKAKDKGIKVYTVGVGTKEGDLIQIPDEQGQMGFLKDAQGNFVKSHLNEQFLQQIAYTTGGAYVHAGGGRFGLDYLYDQRISKLERRDIQEKQEKKYNERFQWPLTMALIFLLLEIFLRPSKQ